MKTTVLLLAVLFCFTATTFAASQTSTAATDPNAPAVPNSIAGYTNFPTAKVKSDKPLLNAFVALTPSFIIKGINERKLAPSSYSVIMRYAFRKDVADGYEAIYYYRARDPAKNSTGKIYYGTFTAFIPTKSGLARKLLRYTIDKAVPRT